jgi:hypothetical protein
MTWEREEGKGEELPRQNPQPSGPRSLKICIFTLQLLRQIFDMILNIINTSMIPVFAVFEISIESLHRAPTERTRAGIYHNGIYCKRPTREEAPDLRLTS